MSAKISRRKVLLGAGAAGAASVLLKHYRIDERHSNAYTAWKELGSPQNPTPEQMARLEAAGARLLNPPREGAGGHLYVFVHPASAGGVLLELIEESGD